MTEEVVTGRGRTLGIVAWVVLPVALLGVLLALTLRNTTNKPTTDPGQPKAAKEENHLAGVRATLAKQNDLATCKAVVAQLNAHLQGDPGSLPPQLPQKTKDDLRKQLGLDEGDLAELTSSTFTPLDAHHLESCFLLRDAARSLELVVAAGRTKQTPLERAELAFAWVVRQVRLQPPSAQGDAVTQEPAPPAFVLRRGWGTPLERALVFLAVLEQFGLDDEAAAGLQGALLFCPGAGKGEEKGRLWACGVAVGEHADALHLFDPRLGLPLPGPGGKGVATLAAVRSEPSVLGQLQIDKVRYDVTPEQAKAAEVFLAVPLSALAPRLALLQNRLLRERAWKDQTLPPQVRVRLAEDLAQARATVQDAVKKSGSPALVALWPGGATVLRCFVPKAAGGGDTGKPADLRIVKAEQALVPLQDYPALLSDPRKFSPDQRLGQRLRQIFMNPFVSCLAPGSAREEILRGRLVNVAPGLVNEQEHWSQAGLRRRAAQPEELQAGIDRWVEEAFARIAALQANPNDPNARAAEQEIWKWRPGDAVAVELFGAIARSRTAEVTYLLGLYNHEVAARRQARKDLAGRGSSAADGRKAEVAWKDAAGYWKEYIDSPGDRPGLVAARRLRGEALAMRGQTKEAVAVWRDLSGPMTDLDRLAHLWLAKTRQ
jgi:hypothetical protein